MNKLMTKVRKNKKGFTLAELLVVVAIIGVLVAVSIPVFGSALEKATNARDLANVRAAYAEVLLDEMVDRDFGSAKVEITIKKSDLVSKSGVSADKIDFTPKTGSTRGKITVGTGGKAGSFEIDNDVTVDLAS